MCPAPRKCESANRRAYIENVLWPTSKKGSAKKSQRRTILGSATETRTRPRSLRSKIGFWRHVGATEQPWDFESDPAISVVDKDYVDRLDKALRQEMGWH